MSSITPVSKSYPVALLRETNVDADFFISNREDVRPIYLSIRSFIRAVDEKGRSASEWEAPESFSTNLTIEEAQRTLDQLAVAIEAYNKAQAEMLATA